MTESFNILVNKLNSFKRKYYFYQLLKGFVSTIFLLLVVFTLFSVVEYFVYLSAEIRKIVFFGFLIFASLLVLQFIVFPVLKLLHILKPIDFMSITELIQKHFSEIEDKLINIIELANSNNSRYSNEIVLASIDQKIDELKVFNFNDAVQYKNIKKIGIYLVISVLVSVGIWIVNKHIFTDSTNRLVHYNTKFVKPAPFTFQIKNKVLEAKKGDSFTFQVETDGDEIPQILYINIEGNNYLMKNLKKGLFEFEMASVINPVQFYFSDLKYNSGNYYLKLLPKPGITQFSISLKPPRYTGIQNKVLENIGDLQVPNGTKIEWKFSGIDIDSLYLIVNDSVKINAIEKDKQFIVTSKFYKSTNYNVFIQNKITQPELALSYFIDVIPDLFPEIKINQINDSLQLTRFFFKGIIGDDYGFSNLSFHYNINNSDSAISIPFVRNLTDQEFYFSFDFKELNVTEGTVSYYFSVSDNDVINHYKTVTSNNFIFEFPNREKMKDNEKKKFDELQKQVEESKQLAKEIQNDLKNLQLKNMDTNISEWEKSQMVNDIISKQNRLEQLYDQIKQENKRLNNYMNSFDKQSEEMAEKQKQIEDLLKEVFTDELKKLMEEFNKLAEDFDSKKLNEMSKQMDLTYEDLQKQLDKNLEMLRKLKVEQNLQNVIDQVNKLAEEEEKMAGEIETKKNFEETKENVNNHKEELYKLEEQLKEALDLNKKLKEPLNFDDFDEDFDDVKKSMDESSKELDKKSKKKAGKSLKNSSDKLKNLAFGMQQMLDMNSSEQNSENIENLKQILSNLLYLSFSQEEILTGLRGINSKDPKLIELNQKQRRIVNQSVIIKDSLYTLSLRVPQLTSVVNNELLTLEINLDKATSAMEEGLFGNARVNQQLVITAANNLALLLNEVLENIEKQMENSQPGSGDCQNPGGKGKPSMSSLKKSSESLKQQLQKMIDQMKNGQGQNMSKELGQSLMQHEMMQQMLRDLMNNGSVGSGTKKQLQQIDKMLDQNRRELMNKKINAQTIKRQNLITTRLLEAEKAEMQRDYDNKRESKSADEFYSNPVKFFKYKEKDNFTIEYLNRNSHKLNSFYIHKYKQYLNNIEKQSDK